MLKVFVPIAVKANVTDIVTKIKYFKNMNGFYFF